MPLTEIVIFNAFISFTAWGLFMEGWLPVAAAVALGVSCLVGLLSRGFSAVWRERVTAAAVVTFGITLVGFQIISAYFVVHAAMAPLVADLPLIGVMLAAVASSMLVLIVLGVQSLLMSLGIMAWVRLTAPPKSETPA